MEKRPLRNEAVQPDVVAAGEKAAREAMDKLSQYGIDASELIVNQRKAPTEVVKGNMHPSGGWLHSPAYFEFNRLALRQLCKVYEQRYGKRTNQVETVRAALSREGNVLYIWPAVEGDLDALEITYDKSQGFLNLYDLLIDEGLGVPTGYRDRHTVLLAPKGSPAWPAIMIHLDKPTARKTEPKSKRGKKSPSADGAQGEAVPEAKPQSKQPQASPAPAAEAGD